MGTSMQGYKILYNRPEITPGEARQMADFDKLMLKHQSGAGNNTHIWLVSGVVFIAILGLLYFGISRDTTEADTPVSISSNEAASIPTEPQNINQSPDAPESPDDLVEKTTEKEMPISTSKVEPQHQEAGSQAAVELRDETSGFVEASPVDGFPALYQYFDDHLVYPREILYEGVEGNVIVKFVIDANGLPSNIIIEKSLHQTLDSAAIALIQQMPKWKPATLDGRAISSTHRIPLFFQIDQSVE
jgi:TonB family protein